MTHNSSDGPRACSTDIGEAIELILVSRSKRPKGGNCLQDKFGDNTLLIPSLFSDDELRVLLHVYETITPDVFKNLCGDFDDYRMMSCYRQSLLSELLADRVYIHARYKQDRVFNAFAKLLGSFTELEKLSFKVREIETEESIGLFVALEIARSTKAIPRKVGRWFPEEGVAIPNLPAWQAA